MLLKVLVTGSNGLVGKSLQKVVAQNEQNSNLFEFFFLTRQHCDLCIENNVYTIFESFKPDVVVHLASCVGGVYDNMSKNYDYLMTNIQINTNIVKACEKYNVKKLINILSTCIFPDKGVVYPLTSDQLHNGLPHHSNIGYAYSKRVLHLASHLLAKKNPKFTVINLTPTNLYGENDNYNLKSSHVIPGLIHKVYNAIKNNEDLTVWGTGKAIRQFLYADDLCNIILEFIKMNKTNNNQNEVSVIVSPPESYETSIKDLVQIICDTFGFKGRVLYDTNYSDGQYKKTTDNSELKRLFDLEFTDLRQGLSNTVKYFCDNYTSVRK